MNVALVELGSLMLHATRRSAALPNMGLVLRFSEQLTHADLAAESKRLASQPYGLGRRLRSPRVPGARPRWVAAPDPPPVAVASPRRDARALGDWLAGELSIRHDPGRGPGWRLGATVDSEGATVVAITLNHLFGTGRDIVTTVYGGDLLRDNGSGPPPASYDLAAEMFDAGDRIRRGALGLLRLAGEAAASPVRRNVHGELAELGKPLAALRDRDPSRGRPSAARVGAITRADASAWAAAAGEHDGSPTALQVAVVANLLRGARLARGGPTERPVRLIVPVDLADRGQFPDAAATVGPVHLTSATVVLPGGPPVHGDLTQVRGQLKRGVRTAIAAVKASGRVPVAPGVVDAMRLLPDAAASRVLFSVHGHYDGAASNVGAVPAGMLRIGKHVATDAFLMAYPLGSDLAVAFANYGDAVALGAVADPSRMGAGPPLRQRVADELRAWNLPATVW